MTCALAGIFGMITVVLMVGGLAYWPLCGLALIPGIIGALFAAMYGRERRRKEEDARTRAIIEAYQRGQYPPPR